MTMDFAKTIAPFSSNNWHYRFLVLHQIQAVVIYYVWRILFDILWWWNTYF